MLSVLGNYVDLYVTSTYYLQLSLRPVIPYYRGLTSKLRTDRVHAGGCKTDVQVDTLLSQLETRFDEMSEQVL